jgi:hypothetical protein
MVDPELLAQAERIARPCVLLKRSGPADALAGVWRGPGTVPAPEGELEHWISIDCRFLPAGLGPSTGVVSVYTDEGSLVGGFVGYDPAARLSMEGGDPLYAHPARSLPPPDALGLEYDDDYFLLYQSSCPVYMDEGIAAVLGGWHFPWPDDDWEELRDRPLLVWTIDESEPWVEAFGGPEGFQVFQRIT